MMKGIHIFTLHLAAAVATTTTTNIPYNTNRS
jgi:hypothetical protein